jgi:3-hydroxyisobutyrate dehydrogenase-like beta-hydroxyacid dehydrogenase
MSETREPQVGLLGLGSIGQHYCVNLLNRFPSVLVFDRDPGRLRAGAEMGAERVASLGELGERCDFVVVSLPNPAAVRQALGGDQGLLASARRGAIVVDTSTVSPEANIEMYEQARARGVGYLDAPVSGGEPLEAGVDGAKAASVTFMVGGDEHVFDKATPIFDALGKFWFHLGPAGSGSVVKLISNLCSGIQLLVAAEAFALGAACGFSAERLIEVFERTDARSYIMTDYVVPRLKRGDVEPGFSVDLQVKDHRLAEALAHDHTVPLPFNALALQTWQRLRADGRGGRDIADSSYFMTQQINRELGHVGDRA